MGVLDQLITTILIDLTKAQHHANEFSAKLSDQYINSEDNLKYFPLPNSLIKGFEFDISFGLDEWLELIDKGFQQGLQMTLHKIADDLPLTLEDSGLLTAEQAKQLEQNIIFASSNLIEEIIKLIRQPTQTSRSTLITALSHQIMQRIRQELTLIIPEQDLFNSLLSNYPATISNYLFHNLPQFESVNGLLKEKITSFFDMQRLRGADYINNIKVQVDMRSFDWAHFNNNNEENSETRSRLIERP